MTRQSRNLDEIFVLEFFKNILIYLSAPGPMDCRPSGSSILAGIFPARILEWLPFPPPGDLPDPEMEPESVVPLTFAGRFFITEPPGKSRVTIWPSNYIPRAIPEEIKTYAHTKTYTQLVKISLTSNSILLDFPGRLRFCISNAGVAGLIPGRRTKIPHAVWQGKPPPHQNTYFLNDWNVYRLDN